jgi:predicted dehydrogenase
MSKNINWGIIGCGNVTEVKSGPAYQKVEGFELKAVMRRNRKELIDYAERHSVEKYYTDADLLINDDEIDAIYIATPPDSHLEYALKVAKAGKPCCIEKPMAPSYEECIEITRAFESEKVPLFVAYYRRSLPRFLKVKEWIDHKCIGEVRHINWNYSCPPKEIDLLGTYNWRTDAKIAKAGYFDDLASHGLDLFNYYFGTVRTANGISANQLGLYTANDVVTGSWIYESGIIGSGSWNFGSYHYEDEVQIIGSKGTIRFSVFKNNAIELDSETKQEKVCIEHPEHIQFYHVEDMKKELIDRNFLHPSNGSSATHTAWVMDQILK